MATKKSDGQGISGDAATALIKQFAREYYESGSFHGSRVKEVDAGVRILKSSPQDQVEFLLASLREYENVVEKTNCERILLDLEEALVRRKLTLRATQFETIAKAIVSRLSYKKQYIPFLKYFHLLKPFENAAPDLKLTKPTVEALETAGGLVDSETRVRIFGILGITNVAPMDGGEIWVDAAEATMISLDSAQSSKWNELFNHCSKAKGSKPTAKWAKLAEALLSEIPKKQFDNFTFEWLPLLKQEELKPRTYTVPSVFTDLNQSILKGLVWCCGFRPTAEMAELLRDTAIATFQKMSGIGPKSAQIGNACLFSLSQMPGRNAAIQFSVLKNKVKQQNARKLIENYLSGVAEHLGTDAAQLEESSVPDFGLTNVGLLKERVGDFTCRLEVAKSTQIFWVNPAGKTQKSIPAAIKTTAQKKLKSIKATKKDIDKMLPVQRQRIEECYLRKAQWDFGAWEKNYLNHPLVGTIARRLIWKCKIKRTWKSVIFHGGKLVTVKNKPIPMEEITHVKLWHPIECSTEEIIAWRDWLLKHEVQQPFKQAHREIYLLTPAEKKTKTRSNRFAAHILKQTQFRGIAPVRKWATRLLGKWDSGDEGVARKLLADWSMTVEFYYVGTPSDEDPDDYGFMHVTSDFVCFVAKETDEPIKLVDIPELVFSEVMRDVDLFVGVCSVGNDPNWLDMELRDRHAIYWQQSAFGELGETAKTRKLVLESILPKLSIKDQCQLQDRFLHVEGKRRTYKIHLGSANIQMEPHNQYLCIVPKRGGEAANVFLPFEGDRILSLIISKAIMLAADDKIKDELILRQINQG